MPTWNTCPATQGTMAFQRSKYFLVTVSTPGMYSSGNGRRYTRKYTKTKRKRIRLASPQRGTGRLASTGSSTSEGSRRTANSREDMEEMLHQSGVSSMQRPAPRFQHVPGRGAHVPDHAHPGERLQGVEGGIELPPEEPLVGGRPVEMMVVV